MEDMGAVIGYYTGILSGSGGGNGSLRLRPLRAQHQPVGASLHEAGRALADARRPLQLPLARRPLALPPPRRRRQPPLRQQFQCQCKPTGGVEL